MALEPRRWRTGVLIAERDERTARANVLDIILNAYVMLSITAAAQSYLNGLTAPQPLPPPMTAPPQKFEVKAPTAHCTSPPYPASSLTHTSGPRQRRRMPTSEARWGRLDYSRALAFASMTPSELFRVRDYTSKSILSQPYLARLAREQNCTPREYPSESQTVT